jgi:hypothetical protein
LAQYFAGEADPIPGHLADRLRRDLTRIEAGASDADTALLDAVLHQVSGLTGIEPDTRWERGTDVDSRWSLRALTGEAVKPRRVWYGPHGAVLPVFVDDSPRVGIGRGRRAVSRVLHWLRTAQQKIAILTNARQWRLIYAGLDFDAWAEWDTDLWFEEGKPGPQVAALRTLLSARSLTPPNADEPAPLLAAIQASRKGQAELSAELGERVRQAVELLIQQNGPRLEVLDTGVTPRDIYVATTRLVMRMVVVLFAEARDLLPRDNPSYHASYGLQGLREILERAGGVTGIDRLRKRHGAWPRVLSLFRLVYEGSHHEALPVPRYGGDLFRPGEATSKPPLRRALAALEDPSHGHIPSDAVVFRVLELLCRSRVKVQQGKSATWIDSPVDFSDLSSEYIGILYEGLLDYELRKATEPMAFLALGDEPLLPLSRLEAMDDAAVAPLVEKLKVKSKVAAADDEDEDEVEADEADAEPDEMLVPEGPGEPEPPTEASPSELIGEDIRQAARDRAHRWARRAVAIGRLVAKSKSKKAEAIQQYEQAVDRAATALIRRVVLPGDWFLVRWGGTRKGAGTFYTRPLLAVPTVQRTLRPLAFDPPVDHVDGEDAAPGAWISKRPEDILALRVCDPAVGSGSFLLASLRFLTDALHASLHQHGRIRAEGETTLVTLAEGKPSGGALTEELLPCRPDAEDFEPRLRARLKRYIVERCLYGVDLDPLAVELARLSLWIETLDRDLPFEFLDHKIKRGNALVGCWFDRFRDYPALAWEREGGDKGHANGVHFLPEVRSKALKEARNDLVKRELAAWIGGQRSLLDAVEGRTPEAIHDEALAVFASIHALPCYEAEERARLYRELFLGSTAQSGLRDAFDTWCSIWFWPADRLADAPGPRTFENPSSDTRTVVASLAEEHQFFHWELEFPDVFTKPGAGFDAVLGNPPWEIKKPNSKEYFSNLDPLYRTYGKQDALRRQNAIFSASAHEERRWLDYNAEFKALANWVKHSGEPFGDGAPNQAPFLGKAKADVQRSWREARGRRKGYSDAEHPFCHQGSADVNTYKLFLEQSHHLLREGGQLGMLVPSGAYTDKGSTALRTLFLTHCRWRWLFGFINWNKVFSQIYYRFKFAFLILEKGGSTDEIRTAFSRYDIEDWEEAARHVILYPRSRVERFSPRSKSLLEVRTARDLEILEKIYSNSVLLGDEGPDSWRIRYERELDMTNDSKLFPPRPVWEAKGYRTDEYGRWIGPGGDIALPVYEGRMIDQFDFSAKGWVSGKGRSAVWRDISWEAKVIEPQFLVGEAERDELLLDAHLAEFKRTYGKDKAEEEAQRLKNPSAHAAWRIGLRRKVAFMDITSATNTRTMIAALLDDAPAGNSVPILRTGRDAPALCGLLNSLVYDFATRARCGGLHLNFFIVEETPLLRASSVPAVVPQIVLRLAAAAPAMALFWAADARSDTTKAWYHLWALTQHERLRLAVQLDAVVAELYGLEALDFGWILRDCDQPPERLSDADFYRTLDPKGLWRVDKEKAPELRHTILALAAFRDLKETIKALDGDRQRGIDAFCTQNGGDGWMLPESLCLADLGLGHDERAKSAQPVRERFGRRFLPRQLEASVAESWADCARHARDVVGEDGFLQLQDEMRADYTTGNGATSLIAGGLADPSVPAGAQRHLFPSTDAHEEGADRARDGTRGKKAR